MFKLFESNANVCSVLIFVAQVFLSTQMVHHRLLVDWRLDGAVRGLVLVGTVQDLSYLLTGHDSATTSPAAVPGLFARTG